MSKKYELVEQDYTSYFRVRALKDIPEIGVKKGDLGGHVESGANLSQEGSAWVSDNAYVYGNALVSGDAHIYGDAGVFGNAYVYGNARVSGNSMVSGDARVYDNAIVSGDANISGLAVIRDADEITSTNQYMVIQGFEYDLTITYSSVHIGGRDFTLDQLDEAIKDKYVNADLVKAILELSLDQILSSMSNYDNF